MKIAIFHNYMDNIGGAEMVVLTLARELHADVYTTVANQENIKRMGFDVRVHTIGWIPKNAPWRQQMALLRMRFLNVSSKYDFFIIAGDWAVSGAVLNKPNLWIAHSPIRELYDLNEYVRETIVPGKIFPQLSKYTFDLWVWYNRRLNKKYVEHIGVIAADSKNIQDRVKKYLQRDSTVIYPPTDTSTFYFNKVGDYWLSVNRLASHKRVEIQLEAFAKLPNEKLIVVGSYEESAHFSKYRKYIEGMRPNNVELMSHVDAPTLRDLYANCKGFITTSLNEDFGLTAVEAMASGKPVIAPNSGGYKETVIDGVTGLLLDDMSPDAVAHAVQYVGKNPLKYKDACIRRAQNFDTKVIISQVKKVVGI